MAIYFFTYADDQYLGSRKKILAEAKASRFFDRCFAYGPKDITPEFRAKFKPVLKQPRGAGYWIWKFHFIQRHLETMSDDDILVYCDAGCTINPLGRKRFAEYIALLRASDKGFISFAGKQKEKWVTTKELSESMGVGMDSPHMESCQFVGGILIIKKCQNALDVLNTCLRVVEKDMYLITDKYNAGQGSFFRYARHDQSILSLARKMHGSIVLPDETYKRPSFDPTWPFWATRRRMPSGIQRFKKWLLKKAPRLKRYGKSARMQRRLEKRQDL